MASSFDQSSDHARFLSFRSPPPSDNHLPIPQPFFPPQLTPSSPLSTAPKGVEPSPLAARGGISSLKKKKSSKRRKPRTSKQSQTTFIAADAANFRQMVQQVTGVRFGDPGVMCASLSRPDPQRAIGNGRSYEVVATSCGNNSRDLMAGLSPAATLFNMPMLSEQRGAGVYGELLGFGPPLAAAGDNGGVGEVGSGLEWGASTPFHTLES